MSHLACVIELCKLKIGDLIEFTNQLHLLKLTKCEKLTADQGYIYYKILPVSKRLIC